MRPYPAVGGIPNGSKFLRDDLTWASTSGLSRTVTFWASSTNGGATDQLQTVVYLNGLVISHTQTGGGGSGHPVARITRLTLGGWGGRRCGSFAGR